jgi:hypothetical protein
MPAAAIYRTLAATSGCFMCAVAAAWLDDQSITTYLQHDMVGLGGVGLRVRHRPKHNVICLGTVGSLSECIHRAAHPILDEAAQL